MESNFNTIPPPTLARTLERGERLLWWGMPSQGVLFRKNDRMLIPFSIMWTGFAVFWETSVVTSDGPVLFKLWGIPFVLIGMYILLGRFIHDAWRRRQIVYAVTSKRVLIATPSKMQSIELSSCNSIQFEETKAGKGTLVFGQEPNPFERKDFGAWTGTPTVPTFEAIGDVRRVFELIRQAQKRGKAAVS